MRPADYAAVLAAPRTHSLRAARHWLAMTAAWFPGPPAVRFGATVGRRHARHAVDRSLVKRVLREAGRATRPALEAHCRSRGVRLDIAFRLKSMRQRGPDAPSLRAWRRLLRTEADGLLARLARHLEELPA